MKDFVRLSLALRWGMGTSKSEFGKSVFSPGRDGSYCKHAVAAKGIKVSICDETPLDFFKCLPLSVWERGQRVPSHLCESS